MPSEAAIRAQKIIDLCWELTQQQTPGSRADLVASVYAEARCIIREDSEQAVTA